MTPPNQSTKTNHLGEQTSPYLRQHATNPVEWYPWGDEALQRAKSEHKPILLSIGYSACHWCHVMAHESFEDPHTANIMNQLFINIKVDREERPDLDKIYQFAHQILTQRGGGWPLTIFLTPEDQLPFFAGTYFPNKPRYGMPSLIEIMQRLAEYRQQHPDEIAEQNQSLQQLLAQSSQKNLQSKARINAIPLDQSRSQLENSFDATYGGFAAAPKFPHPTNIERLMRHWASTAAQGSPDRRAKQMATESLHAMSRGGIYDHLGGGFFRYSVDEQWMIPHFEKMLYDNGPLLYLYTETWRATGEPAFKHTAEETARWVMREMQAKEGGYYSSLDADSEGEEGKFYAWEAEEVKSQLTEDEFQTIAPHFGLDRAANFDTKWHLHRVTDHPKTTDKQPLEPAQAQALLSSARKTLFAHREKRIHPGRDDKVLTAWNGLMIKGMAAAGRRFRKSDYIDSAERALDFIHHRLWQNNRLLVTYKDGKAHLMAYLDDYVFLIDAILELLQARWRSGDLAFAITLADTVLQHFEDKDRGGLFFTANDHEALIQRPKPFADDAIPAGNGIGAFALLRLGYLVGNPRYLKTAEKILQAAWEDIQQLPSAHNALLLALEEYLYPAEIIVIRGNESALDQWQTCCDSFYAPHRLTLSIPTSAHALPVRLAEKKATDTITAYICRGHQCAATITRFADFEQHLASTKLPNAPLD